MPTKIRLQRRGKKGQPFYHIVIADGRAPRDGKFIEKIGTYNPLTKPADIDILFDRALYWLQSGAQPTDTVRTILSYKGIIYKNHLQKGVTKGALTQEQADAKFDAWLKDKEEKIASKVNESEQEKRGEAKKRLDAEKKISEDRAKDLAEKRMAELKAEEAEKVKAATADAEETAEEGAETTGEVAVEEPKAETPVEEAKAETPVEEPKVEEEAKMEEVKEEAKEEKKAEAKEEVKEEVKEEAKT